MIYFKRLQKKMQKKVTSNLDIYVVYNAVNI